MFLKYYSQFDGQPFVAQVKGSRVRVGSSPSSDIVLTSPFVDADAIEFQRHGSEWQIKSLGINGCELGGKKLSSGQTLVWDGLSRISVFPFVFQMQEASQVVPEVKRRLVGQIDDLVRLIHLDMLQQLHLSEEAENVPKSLERLLHVERSIESASASRGITSRGNEPLAAELAGACIRDAILTNMLDNEVSDIDSVWSREFEWSSLATAIPDREEELRRWRLNCERLLFVGLNGNSIERRLEKVESEFWLVWDQQKSKLSAVQREYLSLRQLKKQVKDILFGFGPLEDLLRMPTVSEIMVNASDEIYIEKDGILQNSGRQFVSNEVTQTVIERIVGRVGRRIDTAQPMVDARLPDGNRVNAIIPPLAVKGPCLTVRKFASKQFTMQRLIDRDSITPTVVEFLEACVKAKRSILVSGGTGSGKTTLLNCLSFAIPKKERIICIEDTHELQLPHPHVVFVECRDGNNEGKGKVAIRDLLKNSLRQRPDRLIVGECRSDEALDMLQAMNTGHDGSMTTIHANTPADSLRRLEVLVRHSGLPADAIRQQIVSAIDIVVQLVRDPNGRRHVCEVSEIEGYDESKQQIRLRTIYASQWSQSEGKSCLRPTGCIPTFAADLVRDGHLKLNLFLDGIQPNAG